MRKWNETKLLTKKWNYCFCSFSLPWQRVPLLMFSLTYFNGSSSPRFDAIGTHLEIGLTIVSLLTFTTRACPSWPGKTSNTLARSHWAQRLSGEIAKTLSPALRSVRVSFHFWRVFSNGSHSFIHLFQKWEIACRRTRTLRIADYHQAPVLLNGFSLKSTCSLGGHDTPL